MKNFFHAHLPLLFVLAIVGSSCSYNGRITVDKRHYGKGFFVQVNKHSLPADNDPAIEKTPTALQAKQEPALNVRENIVVADRPSPENNAAVNSNHKKNLPENSAPEKKNPVKQILKKYLPPGKKSNSNSSPGGGGDTNQLILVLLAILLSPLAVYLKEGVTNRFWIDLVCWLLGVGVVGLFYYGGLLLLFAIVFAVLIVLGSI
ncbi:MAG: YqaE/Pmp3 family membrane protein [Bacteroidetes bacterium]|nr:YqaE/Pmp3 family membrane protein [Bacteroidota bacterium]